MRVGRVGGWPGGSSAGRPAHDTSPQAVAMVRDGGRRGCVSSGWWRAGLTVRGASVAGGVIVRAACRVWSGPGWEEVGESSDVAVGDMGRVLRPPQSLEAWLLQQTLSSLPSSDQLSGCPLRVCRLRGGRGGRCGGVVRRVAWLSVA